MHFKVLFCLIPSLLFCEIGYVEPWGKDAGINNNNQAPIIKKLSPMGKATEKIITFYQSSITQISGPRSHFRPTSSQYMLEAIRKYGFVKGYIKGCDRLLRENSDPWVYRATIIEDKLYKSDCP